jgi:mannose/cellobiose epimerase-like protein (N-acyl-D-glucosamine 2-epimerase family)
VKVSDFDHFWNWLSNSALPFWASKGLDRQNGGFHEKILQNGQLSDEPRRARVAGRQIYAFAAAEKMGWSGPAREVVRHGLQWLERHHLTPDNRILPLVSAEGACLKASFDLYDQAFVLFGLAAAAGLDENSAHLERLALRIRDRMLNGWKHPLAGFEESKPRSLPLKANPHMHMLEACLAWESLSSDPGWRMLADEIAQMCLSHFLNKKNGALREFFHSDWSAMTSPPLDVIEPGHQAEWAWLLIRWGRSRSREDAIQAARRLLDIAEGAGHSLHHKLLINELEPNLTIRDPLMRLWPQTERAKAAVAAHSIAIGEEQRSVWEHRLIEAVNGMMKYFDHPLPGSWWEHIDIEGQPIDEPARASSLYHIMCAATEIQRYFCEQNVLGKRDF